MNDHNSKRLPTIFVMMPFGTRDEYRDKKAESDYVFNKLIVPSVALALPEISKEQIVREVDTRTPGSITASLITKIADADVVIADLTGCNPNVFLELGIRYAVRRRVTILMAQSDTPIPFDVSNQRVVKYKVVEPDSAIHDLSRAIMDGLANEQSSDSPVFDAFNEMHVSIPGHCASDNQAAGSQNVMEWHEYWQRISHLVQVFEAPCSNGHFIPEAVIGISNGGLMVADLLSRLVFRGHPVLSLWANRTPKPHFHVTDPRFPMFANVFNDSVIKSIKSQMTTPAAKSKLTARRKRSTTRSSVLVCDDLLDTGSTALQAITYLETRFGDAIDVLFLPLFCTKQEALAKLEQYLPHKFRGGSVFSSSSYLSFDELKTSAARFPYLKPCRR